MELGDDNTFMTSSDQRPQVTKVLYSTLLLVLVSKQDIMVQFMFLLQEAIESLSVQTDQFTIVSICDLSGPLKNLNLILNFSSSNPIILVGGFHNRFLVPHNCTVSSL